MCARAQTPGRSPQKGPNPAPPERMRVHNTEGSDKAAPLLAALNYGTNKVNTLIAPGNTLKNTGEGGKPQSGTGGDVAHNFSTTPPQHLRRACPPSKAQPRRNAESQGRNPQRQRCARVKVLCVRHRFWPTCAHRAIMEKQGVSTISAKV